MRVRKLVDFFEATLRYLGLVGLSAYHHYGLQDDDVNAMQTGLRKPSLGHWLGLLKSLERPLGRKIQITAPLNQKHHQNPISAAVQELCALLDQPSLKTIRLSHFLDSMVSFRNDKIGHGVLAASSAKKIEPVINEGLKYWTANIPILQARHLLYIHQVAYEGDHYTCTGTRNAGTSLYPAHFETEQGLHPRQVYLRQNEDESGEELIPLHPLITFDNDDKVFYTFNGVTKKGYLVLRCQYSAAHLQESLEIDTSLDNIFAHREPSSQKKTKRAVKPAPKKKTSRKTAHKSEVSNMTTSNIWYDIITPHEDIRKGRLDEAIFHADLHDVATGAAPEDYRDPYLFFSKTYLTQGLQNLLQRVHTTLTQGHGSSVVQIQTPFGGGKTHALVAIYHYLKHSDRVKELLPPGVPPFSAPVSAIAGNQWEPLEGRETDGVRRHTFWGDLAYQIGGVEGYEVFRKNDEARVSPGTEKLRQFLLDHQPFVLLFDEILEYINRAIDVREQIEGSLGTQTFSFFQELTEAVAAIPKGMLVVTLPSSYLEDFSEKEEESLARLGKIFGRVESIETPVQDEEVYAVIRRRLFEVETLKQAEMRTVVHHYFRTYQNNRDDLPTGTRNVEYRDKMELSYPFHPSVIDILYEKWSTFSSFQRTRGVLRLLANVVEDLYKHEAPINMILPGDINLNHPSIREEFLKHIGREYEGVIGSDVAGHEAKAPAMDKNYREWKHLAQRISTSIFYHSFSADDSSKGINLPYIRLASMRGDTIPALVSDVLQRLSNALWYLNSRGDVYYFSDIPNLNRMIMDKKELFNESYEPKLREIIEKEIGKEFRVYVWPENGDGIPDNRDLKLVVLRPEDSGDRISQWLERKGETFREYKNTLFFALADTAAFASLREDVKKVLALQEIEDEIKSGESSLPEEKRAEIQRQMHAIQRDFSYNVRRMYHVLHLGDRDVDLGNPTTGAESLSHWYWRELTSNDVGSILPQLHYRFLVDKFLTKNDQIATSVLLDQFYKDPDLPVPASSGVVARAIQLGIKDGAFGLVEVFEDEIAPETLKFKTDFPLDGISFDPGTFLLNRERSRALWMEIQPTLEGTAEPGAAPTPGAPEGVLQPPAPKEGEPTLEPARPEEGRYQRVRLVISGIPASKIADVNRGILLPFIRAVGDFEFTLEIDVSSEEGISESTLENQIKETIRQIGGIVVGEELG